MKNSEKTLDMIVNLCKNRGFIYPGSEIYGGLANTWDYGPLGVELKNNWVAGVVPAEKPQYAIVVLQDAQTVPVHSSAAIFAALAEMLENFGA